MRNGVKRAQVIPRGITLLLTLLLALMATFFMIAFAWKPIPTDPLRRLAPQVQSPVENVSNTSGAESRRPAMTISGGNTYVAWREGNTPAEIYFNKKVAGSWSGNVNVSQDATESAAPAIAATGNDVHLVWQDTNSYDIFYKQSTDGGTTWGGSQVIPDGGNECLVPPAVAISGTVPHVVWGEDTPSGLRIFYSNRTGGSWLASPIGLTASLLPGQDANHPSIGAGNYLHAAWDISSGTKHFIAHRRSTNGVNWSDLQDISGDVTNDGDSTHPDIAVQDSYLFVVWSTLIQTAGENKTYTIRFNKSDDGGATWLTSSSVIATPTIRIGFINEYPVPRVALSDTNTIYVTWHQGTDQADVMSSVSTDGGNSWSATPDNVSASSQNSQMACVAIGSTHVVWEEQVGDKQYDIYHQYTTGIEEDIEDKRHPYLPIIVKNY